MMDTITRREALKRIAILGAGSALGTLGLVSQGEASRRRRVLRIAHLTDIHLQPEGIAVEGTLACLREVHEMRDRPNLILTGGDSVMDVFNQKRERANTLGKLWREVFVANCKIPAFHCVGNHDVWGWNRERSGCTGDEPDYGKKWATELFEIERPYYSFDRAGWHFVVLDSTFSVGNSYIARLDDAQFEWLQADLAQVNPKTPVLVLSHMPILSVCAYIDGNNEKTGNWVIPGDWVHIDARRIIQLFHKHPNVKLCLSGHMHQYDRAEYDGVTYVCNGAVSGSWWSAEGNYYQTVPGYGIVDLYSDGTFQCEYRPFRGYPKRPSNQKE